MLHEDSMSDPFPQGTHVGVENVIYSQMELIDKDRQFRYAFVESILIPIRRVRDEFSKGGIFEVEALKDKILKMPADTATDQSKLVNEIAMYVYTNLQQKFKIAGHTDKLSFLDYYTQMQSPEFAEYLYVMIFLMRQQQWLTDKFDAYKEYTRARWIQHQQSTSAQPVSEDVLGNFERVLETADEWINDIIQKEPIESSAKRAKVVKPDRHAIGFADMLNENDFTIFTQYSKGIMHVSAHFQICHQNETTKKKTSFEEALAQKPLTSQLYPVVKQMFKMSNFRFRQHYPLTLRQWQYWVIRAIISLQVDTASQEQWYGYLDHAQKIETDTSKTGHYKIRNANFPLGADFDFSEPAVLTQDATESLSARIDRLNDW